MICVLSEALTLAYECELAEDDEVSSSNAVRLDLLPTFGTRLRPEGATVKARIDWTPGGRMDLPGGIITAKPILDVWLMWPGRANTVEHEVGVSLNHRVGVGFLSEHPRDLRAMFGPIDDLSYWADASKLIGDDLWGAVSEVIMAQQGTSDQTSNLEVEVEVDQSAIEVCRPEWIALLAAFEDGTLAPINPEADSIRRSVEILATDPALLRRTVDSLVELFREPDDPPL
jgi:hypothetical protein